MTNTHSESDLEASHQQGELQRLIEELIADNNELKWRMYQIENSFDAGSILTRRLANNIEDDASTIRELDRRKTAQRPSSPSQHHLPRSTSQLVLEQSWVYRRNQKNDCDCSFTSSIERSHIWSMFSKHTLADISVLSVIAMPLTTLDVANGRYYEVDNERQTEARQVENAHWPLPDWPLLDISEEGISNSKTGRVPTLSFEDFQKLQKLVTTSTPLIRNEGCSATGVSHADVETSTIDINSAEEVYNCSGCDEASILGTLLNNQ